MIALTLLTLGSAVGVPTVAADSKTSDLDIDGLGEVFFAFDSAQVIDRRDAVPKILAYADAHPNAKIVLDGYTDTLGTPASNIRLASQRARNLRNRLIVKGLDSDRILLGIYGEDGLRRSTPAADRRVTVWATEEPLHVIIDLELPEATAMLWDRPGVTAAQIDGPRATGVATR
jgi:hypothetical protein